MNTNVINPAKIVASIKKEILQQKLDKLADHMKNPTGCLFLYEADIPALTEGWHEYDPLSQKRFRWTTSEFSFIYNLGQASHVSFHIEDAYSHRKITSVVIHLFIEDTYIESQSVDRSGIVTFSVPLTMQNKPVVIKCRLTHRQNRLRDDFQMQPGALSVAVRSIVSAQLSNKRIDQYLKREEQWNRLREEYNKRKEHMNIHASIDSFLKNSSRFLYIKKVLYRMLRLYTSVQSQYNRMSLEQMDNLYKSMRVQLDIMYETEILRSLHLEEPSI